jgi:pimeloyl-ACP methyl ester carboxylesterase
MTSTSSPEEILLTCQDGVTLAGQRYRNITSDTNDQLTTRILCWHGWLDNCRSFHAIGSALTGKLQNVDMVALDFPGHGKSGHKSLDGATTILMDYVYYVYDAIHQLEWQDEAVVLLGHSMGAAVSLMYAAAFPVQKLILLDSLGPQTKKSTDVVSGFQKHVKQRLKGKPPCSIYESFEHAVQTRCATAKAFPGNQYISEAAAKELVSRASTPLPDGRLQFLHDQRLKWSSMLSLTDEQVHQLYMDVASSDTTRTALLLAKDGMPFPPSMVSQAKGLLKPAVCKILPGSHHFHMDPDSSHGVVDELVAFLG